MTKSTKSTVTKGEIRFSEVEIQRINDLRIAVSGVFTQLGQVSIEKLRLEPSMVKQPMILKLIRSHY